MANDTKPRRKPKRRTGEQIVASILDAAEQLLVAEGFKKLTTNAIAERAGVSVGSVYQYFPNKQAIVAGITKRINEAMIRQVKEVLSLALPLEERLYAIIDVMCSRSALDGDLRRALLLHVPRGWEHTGMALAEQEIAALVDASVKELAPNTTPREMEDRKLAMIFATRGAAQGALLHRPELLDDGRLTRILVDMFLGRSAGTHRE